MIPVLEKWVNGRTGMKRKFGKEKGVFLFFLTGWGRVVFPFRYLDAEVQESR